MKEYKIELCKADFHSHATYIKSAIVKIEMSEEEMSDFYKRYNNGEDLYVVFTCNDKSVRYKIKEPMDFLSLSYKGHVAVSLVRG